MTVYYKNTFELVRHSDMGRLLSPLEAVSSHSVKNGGQHAETGRACTGVSAMPSVHYSVSVLK